MKFIFNTSHREYEVASWHPAFDCEDRDDHVERTTARFCGPFFLVVTRPPRTAAMSGVPA